MKVWSVSQAVSTSGILSAKNSTTKSASAMPQTTGWESTASEGGRWMIPKRSSSPAAAMVA